MSGLLDFFSSTLTALQELQLFPNSLQPHGLQPARLLCPCHSPGKNTGVGCHSLLQGIFPTQGWNLGLLHCRQIFLLSEPPGMPLTSVCAGSVASVMYDSLRLYGLQPSRLFCPWNSLGKNTRVGCHFLLQGIFLTQGSNLGLPHCRQILYCLSHQGSL